MRRVDRRTNALPIDRQTDRQTDQPTDTAGYRGALSHLKMMCYRLKTVEMAKTKLKHFPHAKLNNF